MMAGKLYLVALPIGNLEDITLRAIRTLRSVDAILAEDTRTTRRLLERYRIRTPFLSSLYQGVERQRLDWILERLRQGADLALVSDAGTPLISDPGYPLVREAIEAGIGVIPVPGPSALLTALVASGIPPDRFCFEGALPRKKGERRARIERLRSEERTIVLYESPHRLRTTLEIIADLLPDRTIVLARELTKRHEEFLRDTASGLLKKLEARDSIKGECALVLPGKSEPAASDPMESERFTQAVSFLRQVGLPNKTIADFLSTVFGVSRNAAYDLAHNEDPRTS